MEPRCHTYNTMQLYVQAYRFFLVAARELRGLKESRRPRALSGTRLQAASIAASSLRNEIGAVAHAYGHEIVGGSYGPKGTAPWKRLVPEEARFPSRLLIVDAYDAADEALTELERARASALKWGNNLDDVLEAMELAARECGRLNAAIGADWFRGIWVVRSGDGRFVIAPQGDPAHMLVRGAAHASEYLREEHAGAVAAALMTAGLLDSAEAVPLHEALGAPGLADDPSVWLDSADGIAIRGKDGPARNPDEHWKTLVKALG